MSQGLKIGGDSEQPDHCGEHTRSGHIRLHFGVLISIVLICLGELKSQLKLLCYSYSVSTTQVKETSSKYCFDRCARDSFYEEVSLEGVQNGIQALISDLNPPMAGKKWKATLTQKKDYPPLEFHNIVSIVEEKYELRYVYVWQEIIGY